MRKIIEAVVGKTRSEVDDVMNIIAGIAARFVGKPNASAQFEQAANPELAQYGIRFDANDEELRRVGAPARTAPGEVVFRTPSVSELARKNKHFATMLSHELVHAAQLKGAEDTGSVDKMYATAIKRTFPKGHHMPMDREAYFTDRQEVMAYARTAVDGMLDQGMTAAQMLGAIKGGRVFSPVLRHDQKTDKLFRKYATAYAQQLGA